MSTLSGLRVFLTGVTMLPTLQKSLSDGVLVAETVSISYLVATREGSWSGELSTKEVDWPPYPVLHLLCTFSISPAIF